MMRFTHLLLEAKSKYSQNIKPYVNSHEILEFIDGFSSVSFNYNNFPPVKIRTRPSICILKNIRKDSIQDIEISDQIRDILNESELLDLELNESESVNKSEILEEPTGNILEVPLNEILEEPLNEILEESLNEILEEPLKEIIEKPLKLNNEQAKSVEETNDQLLTKKKLKKIKINKIDEIKIQEKEIQIENISKPEIEINKKETISNISDNIENDKMLNKKNISSAKQPTLKKVKNKTVTNSKTTIPVSEELIQAPVQETIPVELNLSAKNVTSKANKTKLIKNNKLLQNSTLKKKIKDKYNITTSKLDNDSSQSIATETQPNDLIENTPPMKLKKVTVKKITKKPLEKIMETISTNEIEKQNQIDSSINEKKLPENLSLDLNPDNESESENKEKKQKTQ